jgi:outer membrane protein OmpA-like peptidoglycan-associated protein
LTVARPALPLLLLACLLGAVPAPASAGGAEDIVQALLPRPAAATRSIAGNRGIAIEGGDEKEEPPSIDLAIPFEYDQSALSMSDAQIIVDTLGKALKDPRLAGQRFSIIGHTDARGGDAYNLALSQRRAEAVRARLVQFHGVDASRLVAEGHGMRELKDPARPESGINRRVQVKLLAAAGG